MKRKSLGTVLTTVAIMFVILAANVSASESLEPIRAALNGAVDKGIHSTIEEDPAAPDHDAAPRILETTSPGKDTFGKKGAVVDYSNAKDGYVTAKYSGKKNEVRVQIESTKKGSAVYTYNLRTDGEYQTLPLTLGSATYSILIYAVVGAEYKVFGQKDIKVEIKNEDAPFLRPNHLVDYSMDSACVSKASELCKNTKSPLAAAEKIYLYVIENTSYDYEKAETLTTDYIPNPDDTLKSGKGICMDFAALAAAMMRSQGIPCKFVEGYANGEGHAWIEIYSEETGTFAATIEFGNAKYYTLDPTYVATGDKSDPNSENAVTEYEALYRY